MKEEFSKADVSEVVESYKANKFDPQGSYTGIDKYNPMAQPTQDVDDL